MAMPEMDAVKDAALKYDKPTLARLAQMGQLSPTIAVMAGMMRDRIVQSEMKPPAPPTVAQEVMQPMGQRMGLAAAAQPQQPQQQGQGLNQVPVPPQMFERQGMAGGGIVAFQAGGQSRIAGALEGVLARLKERDPSLNLDYVRSAILKAPREQQETLVNQLMASVGEAPARAMPASFTEAISEADPRQADTGAQFGARAIPGSQVLAQKADAAGNIYRDVGGDFDQADTGAQPGATPGQRDFPGSLILAQKADRAGNIYARPTPQAGIAALSQANAAPAPAQDPFQVDPFSGTQTYEGYPEPVIADRTQTDTGAADRTGSPSAAMLKAEADEQAKLNADATAAAKETAKEKPIDQSSIMRRAGEMATGILGKPGTEGIKIPTVAEASKETSDLLKASGFDSNLFKTLQSDIAKQREDLKGDRKEAMNLRLIEAGLGIMGGESPNAFVNIGKGAAPAIKGLGEDIKGLKKAERELVNAERDLRMKENDFALGKAKISQAAIDKARDRADKEREQFTRLQGEFAKTMLSGKIQEQIARATYSSRMTDFDKQYAMYEAEAKARGETPTWTGFTQSKQAGMTREDATRIASTMPSIQNLDLTTPQDRQTYEQTIDFIMQQGRRPMAAAPTGPAPSPPKGFVIQ